MSGVVLTCFAGRQRYLEILKPYIDKLLSRGLIDECHMWDYTRNDSDSEWLKNNFTSIFHPSDKTTWSDYYNYYTSERYPDPATVVIKCDDDIVYIDVDQFQTFIDNRRSDTRSLIAYAGIINNRHIGHRQYEHGILPFLDEANIMYDVRCCEHMHDYFTTNYTDVISKARLHGAPSHFIPSKSIQYVDGAPNVEVLNINFIAVLAKDLWAFQDAVSDDEAMLAIRIPHKHKKCNYIDTSFTVVHMAFTSQRANGFDETPFMERYKVISSRSVH